MDVVVSKNVAMCGETAVVVDAECERLDASW